MLIWNIFLINKLIHLYLVSPSWTKAIAYCSGRHRSFDNKRVICVLFFFPRFYAGVQLSPVIVFLLTLKEMSALAWAFLIYFVFLHPTATKFWLNLFLNKGSQSPRVSLLNEWQQTVPRSFICLYLFAVSRQLLSCMWYFRAISPSLLSVATSWRSRTCAWHLESKLKLSILPWYSYKFMLRDWC